MKLDEIQEPRITPSMKKLGAVPWISQSGKVLMMFMIPSDPAYGGTAPQIAKGNQDPGESAHHAALREAAEELGLRGSNILEVLDPAVTETVQTQTTSYDLTVYAVQVRNLDDFDQPHYETASVHWLTLEEFKIRGRKNQQSLVRKLHAQIVSKLNTQSTLNQEPENDNQPLGSDHQR
jgi:8-oxo-dGTP pyrophosphatase MutT (NUDIX family)